MQAHDNHLWVGFELSFLLAGVPVLGAAYCAFLWQRTVKENNSDRRQYQRLGLGATGCAFAQLLAVLAENLAPQRFQTFAVVSWIPFLALAGVLAAATGAVLILLNGRGVDRYGGFVVSLVAVGYSALTILACLAGGGGL